MYKKSRKKSLAHSFLLVGLFFLVSLAVIWPLKVNHVLAQAEDEVYIKNQELEKINELRDLYKLQMESYRTQEKTYQIAVGQYRNLNTLVSLEEAVKATKAAMVIRSQVLITYTQLVQAYLNNTPGVNLANQAELSDQLTARITEIQSHLLQIEASDDRDAIAERASEFALLKPAVESSVHFAMIHISLGKLENVYDRALLLHTDIVEAQKTATSSAIKRAERDRANIQVERSLAEAKSFSDNFEASLQKLQSDNRPLNSSQYSTRVTELTPVYSQLSQVVAYLKELLSI